MHAAQRLFIPYRKETCNRSMGLPYRVDTVASQTQTAITPYRVSHISLIQVIQVVLLALTRQTRQTHRDKHGKGPKRDFTADRYILAVPWR